MSDDEGDEYERPQFVGPRHGAALEIQAALEAFDNPGYSGTAVVDAITVIAKAVQLLLLRGPR